MTEERLRERLRDVAGTAVESHDDYDRLWDEGVAKRRRRTAAVALGSLAVSGVVVAAAFAGVAAHDSGATDDGAPTATQPSTTPWQQLTGEAVGEALGLKTVEYSVVNDHPECLGEGNYYTQYEPGRGFCYHPADLGITDPVEADLLAWQIMGFQRSDDLIEFVELRREQAELQRLFQHTHATATQIERYDYIKSRLADLSKEIGLG
jgi:hypothetical protein